LYIRLVVLSHPVDYVYCHIFLLRYRHLRGLDSFPTRRSSDLRAAWARQTAPARTCGKSSPPRARAARLRPSRTGTGRRRAARARSEEHTSELQSRENLVCRLLLEKKKNNMITTTSMLNTKLLE